MTGCRDRRGSDDTPERPALLAYARRDRGSRSRAQPDGPPEGYASGRALRVDISLIFDAGPGTSEPVWWSIGGTRIGWESAERRAQYWVNPTVTEVAAQELTPDGAKIPISVVVDDTGYHDPFLDAHVFRLIGPSTCASASAGSVAYNDSKVIDLSTEAVGLVSPAGLSVQPKPALERSR